MFLALRHKIESDCVYKKEEGASFFMCSRVQVVLQDCHSGTCSEKYVIGNFIIGRTYMTEGICDNHSPVDLI